MHGISFRHLDLNLLVVFEALLEEQGATRAGKRLGLSQAAVSHSLNRLRATFQDELFVKRSQGMLPTSLALALAPEVIAALDHVRLALGSLDFDPVKDERVFRIAMTDYFSSIALPRILSDLSSKAPRVRLRTVSNRLADVPQLLEAQKIDFAIGVMRNDARRLPETLETETLLDDDYKCVMRCGHPLAAQLGMIEYCAAEHLLLSLDGEDTGMVDTMLKKEGLRRNISITVTHYLAAPMILRTSDLIMTVSARMAHIYADHFDLVANPLPFEMPVTPTQLVWASRFAKQSALRWMRELLHDACRSL